MNTRKVQPGGSEIRLKAAENIVKRLMILLFWLVITLVMHPVVSLAASGNVYIGGAEMRIPTGGIPCGNPSSYGLKINGSYISDVPGFASSIITYKSCPIFTSLYDSQGYRGVRVGFNDLARQHWPREGDMVELCYNGTCGHSLTWKSLPPPAPDPPKDPPEEPEETEESEETEVPEEAEEPEETPDPPPSTPPVPGTPNPPRSPSEVDEEVPDELSQANGLHFAHFATGEGYTTEIVVVNLHDEPIDLSVHFYDTQGEFHSVERFSAVDAYSQQVIETIDAGPLVTGSVHVKSNGPVFGFLRFNHEHFGKAVVGPSPYSTRMLIPVRRISGNMTTGVALYNTGPSSATVRCGLSSNQGAHGVYSFWLRGYEQTSWAFDEVFPGADTSLFDGYMLCTSRVPFSAMALEIGDGVFASLPVEALIR